MGHYCEGQYFDGPLLWGQYCDGPLLWGSILWWAIIVRVNIVMARYCEGQYCDRPLLWWAVLCWAVIVRVSIVMGRCCEGRYFEGQYFDGPLLREPVSYPSNLKNIWRLWFQSEFSPIKAIILISDTKGLINSVFSTLKQLWTRRRIHCCSKQQLNS
jgi:hypothetical protein